MRVANGEADKCNQLQVGAIDAQMRRIQQKLGWLPCGAGNATNPMCCDVLEKEI